MSFSLHLSLDDGDALALSVYTVLVSLLCSSLNKIGGILLLCGVAYKMAIKLLLFCIIFCSLANRLFALQISVVYDNNNGILIRKLSQTPNTFHETFLCL